MLLSIDSHPSRMIDFDELCSIAYKKERAQSRRLARDAALSPHDALVRILEKSAGEKPLDQLVIARRAAQHMAQTSAQQAREARAARQNAVRAARAATPGSWNAGRRVDTWTAWFDGSALPNPGRLGIGGLLAGPQGETVEISAPAGHGDSSNAEYLALIAVLEAALAVRPAKLLVYGDSRVVIDDVLRRNGPGAAALEHHAERARALIDTLGTVELSWIPRLKNARADALSRQAVRAA